MHYRFVIFLAAYDPYKDVFDIFIDQFYKNWPDCPYPLVIANMHFNYEGNNVILINCGDMPSAADRMRVIMDKIDADYYLGMEEDRMITKPINSAEIEEILDFMDKEKIKYFRCDASKFKKRESDKFQNYEHYYHIPNNEPYGVCGSTSIWSRELLEEFGEKFSFNGYKWESYQNSRAGKDSNGWVDGCATCDSNLLGILHCIDKQKWISSSRKKLIKKGYKIDKKQRQVHSLKETIIFNLKNSFMTMSSKNRHRIKNILKRFGFHFETEW